MHDILQWPHVDTHLSPQENSDQHTAAQPGPACLEPGRRAQQSKLVMRDNLTIGALSLEDFFQFSVGITIYLRVPSATSNHNLSNT